MCTMPASTAARDISAATISIVTSSPTSRAMWWRAGADSTMPRWRRPPDCYGSGTTPPADSGAMASSAITIRARTTRCSSPADRSRGSTSTSRHSATRSRTSPTLRGRGASRVDRIVARRAIRRGRFDCWPMRTVWITSAASGSYARSTSGSTAMSRSGKPLRPVRPARRTTAGRTAPGQRGRRVDAVRTALCHRERIRVPGCARRGSTRAMPARRGRLSSVDGIQVAGVILDGRAIAARRIGRRRGILVRNRCQRAGSAPRSWGRTGGWRGRDATPGTINGEPWYG